MAPRKPRDPVFELEQKFGFLKQNAISRAHCGHEASDSSFCEKLGISRTTLMSSVKAHGLTVEHQQMLARKCDFSLNWLEWNDPEADRNAKREARRDTCEAFKARYLEHHGKEEPKSSPPPALPVLLKEDLLAKTEKIETQLASLALRFGQSEPMPGEAVLKFDLNCPEVVADAFSTGVKQAFLTFHCGLGQTTEAKDRTGYPSGVEFNGAKFTPYSMDKKEPSWLVTASGAGAIGIVGNVTETFIRVMNLIPGASVSADLTACVRDIATTFALPEGRNQSLAKQKIKKRLREMRLSGGEDGIVKLALAEIKLAAWDD